MLRHCTDCGITRNHPTSKLRKYWSVYSIIKRRSIAKGRSVRQAIANAHYLTRKAVLK